MTAPLLPPPAPHLPAALVVTPGPCMQAVDFSNNNLRKQGVMAAVAWAHTLPALRVLRMRCAGVPDDIQHDVSSQLGGRVDLSW